MAFDFIKKVFSFGRKKVEEIGPDGERTPDDAETGQPPAGVQSGTAAVAGETAPLPEFLRRDDAPPPPLERDQPREDRAEPSEAGQPAAELEETAEPDTPATEPIEPRAPPPAAAEPEPDPAPHEEVAIGAAEPAEAKEEPPASADAAVDQPPTPEAPEPEPRPLEGRAAGAGAPDAAGEVAPASRDLPSEEEFDGRGDPVQQEPAEAEPGVRTVESAPEVARTEPALPQPSADAKPAPTDAFADESETGDRHPTGRETPAGNHAVPEVEPTPASPEEPLPPPASPAPAGKVTVARKVEQKAQPVPAAAPEPKLSWYQRLRQGLSRSSKELTGNISGIFTKRRLDEDTLQDLEDVLLRADLGMETAIRITDALASGRYGKSVSDEEVRAIMAQEVEKVLAPVALPLELDLSHKPHVILVVGVNGTGKTTTIGKLAAKLAEGGLSVTLAAGDTFRAAAIEQLKIWGERTGSPVVSSKLGADAAGLAYDAFEKARDAGADVLIIDTAGRLQNKAELMAELEKIVRVLGKLDPEAPHTVLQTVDATTGQNALNQVEIFRNVAGVNGLVMTKLDGTARGGILVAIAARHKLPVYFIGVGEQVDDLEPFSADDFAKAIAGVE